MSPGEKAPRPRDRDATARRLLDAALRILARDGFGALGMNVIAAEAGCDKKLIYRYFGGLEGLVAALGSDIGIWLGGAAPVPPEGADYAGRLAALLDGYAAGLRADPALQQILAAELVAPSDTLQALEERRSRAFGQWVQASLGTTRAPESVDAPAVNAILLAALTFLVLRARTVGRFAGMEIASPEGRARVDAALHFLLRRAYEEKVP